MEYRTFGTTDLTVSVIGFGAWGIGGGVLAGDTPIGWGNVDDTVSIRALERAYDRGITFFDTADFYGLGHSEELIGKTFGNRGDVVIATKVGHRLLQDGSIALDYSREHILQGCEESLRRLKRDVIDLYQLHSAKYDHLRAGECIEAMERLVRDGKIRYWGLSLNTYHPEREAEYMMARGAGHGFQLVLNVLNQRSLPLIEKASKAGYGIIARMPLQFGLLTGKFGTDTVFSKNDHRSMRLPKDLLITLLASLEETYWPVAEKLGISKTAVSLSFAASVPGVSTVIPGIKTPEQADTNTTDIRRLEKHVLNDLFELGRTRYAELVRTMEKTG
jgi:aryl-alcohol dehydrogenase-like predicted oxidoreductase